MRTQLGAAERAPSPSRRRTDLSRSCWPSAPCWSRASGLVFACAVCSEAFTSAGRLRSHHGRQHGPPPEPRASPPPPAEVTVGRRRRRRTRFVTTAATEDEDSPEEYPVMDVEDMAEGARRTRPSRGPSTSGVASLKCDLCGKVLSSATKLAVHQRMHSGERPHICTYCPKRCNDLGNLRKHEQLHFKERPFRCDTCTITFWTAIRQRAHRCKLARSQDNSDEAGDSMDMTEAGQSTSTEIPAESKETMILDSENVPMELSGSGLPALAAAAELAAARPPREPSPKREPNANSGQAPVVPVDCDVCGRQLRSVSGWQRHRRLHAGVRPYLCRFCDKTCNDSGNMRKHEAGHFKERPYRCDTCCITFVNTWRLGMHQCKLRADGGPPTEGSAPSPTMSSAAAEVEVEAVLESRPALPVPPPRGRHAPPPQLDARGRRRDHTNNITIYPPGHPAYSPPAWDDFSGFYIGLGISLSLLLLLAFTNFVCCCCCPRYKEYIRDPRTGNRWALPLFIMSPKHAQPLDY
ncbi:Zinc finger and BTB domain-containing protein 24 [Amphibalanus amphitrite]|uniref:Zinc finger and BTB domain-containing protein 24 n=1 Tax=Amphibalanus amphitrite TaxID=1232801 RepID=A0A6A4WZR3_AMPAM|nr:Zinc finger and BTB domain-containing protein 24 [Amphibalanus amphitrite]